jgi:hypothetical protein
MQTSLRRFVVFFVMWFIVMGRKIKGIYVASSPTAVFPPSGLARHLREKEQFRIYSLNTALNAFQARP